MKLTANKIAGILRKNGYKLTPQRHAVLQAIASTHDYLTPEEIYRKVNVEKPDIGLATIYRTLEILGELNLVCRVYSTDGCRNYMMRRPTEHHHHLICSGCGKTFDFTDCNLDKLEKRLSTETGFSIDGHLLELYGRCRDCATATDCLHVD